MCLSRRRCTVGLKDSAVMGGRPSRVTVGSVAQLRRARAQVSYAFAMVRAASD